MMGEQPIFTTKAHVFQIDPGTKKKWLPSCSQAINVSYYYDSIRNTYRIISVDGSKAIINSTITLSMAFTKTSQKFGQWTDHQANTVYGLGFSSEAELNKFIEKFKEVKELMRQQGEGPHKPGQTNGTAGSVDSNHSTPDKHNTSISNSNQQLHITDHSPGDALSPGMNSSSPALAGSSNVSVTDQLKYENDRLKLALAQSSANAKKWEVELQILKNNNVRLTTALQESTTNVDEWKRQLAAYKEESARMKKKVLDMEQGSGGGSELLQRQLSDLRDKMVDSERGQTAKQQEVDALTRRLDGLQVVEKKNADLNDKIKHLEDEKAALQRQIEEVKRKQEEGEAQRVRDRQQLLTQQQHISKLSTELHDASNKMADILRFPPRS